MFVSETMSTCIAECTEDTKLEDVFELIQKCDHGMVVVVDSLAHRIPIGVVTERSICEQIIARGRNPRTLAAGSVMDSRIKRVLNSELVENIDMRQGDISAIIAVDENRRLCGLVSKEQLKRAVAAARKPYRSVPVNTKPAAQPRLHRISEIPAFGWMS